MDAFEIDEDLADARDREITACADENLAALTELARDSEESRSFLISQLNEGTEVDYEIAKALVPSGALAAAAIPACIDRLNQGGVCHDSFVELIVSAGALSPMDVCAMLERALSERPNIWETAGDVLARLARQAEDIQNTIQQWLIEPTEGLRAAAIAAVALTDSLRSGTYFEQDLDRGVRSSQVYVRAAAVWAAGQLDTHLLDETSIELLCRGLLDADPYVRSQADRFVHHLTPASSNLLVPALMSQMMNDDADWERLILGMVALRVVVGSDYWRENPIVALMRLRKHRDAEVSEAAKCTLNMIASDLFRRRASRT